MGLLDALTQIVNAATQNAQPQQQHVDEVMHTAAPDVLSQGLREAFDSQQTPSIGEMVGQMFGQSSGQQQAGLINQIIQALGPAGAAALAGGVLQKVMKPGEQQVSAAAANQLSPAEISAVVNEAQSQRPELTQQLSDFYAQHSSLIKALGGVALLAAAIKMKQYSERT